MEGALFVQHILWFFVIAFLAFLAFIILIKMQKKFKEIGTANLDLDTGIMTRVRISRYLMLAIMIIACVQPFVEIISYRNYVLLFLLATRSIIPLMSVIGILFIRQLDIKSNETKRLVEFEMYGEMLFFVLFTIFIISSLQLPFFTSQFFIKSMMIIWIIGVIIILLKDISIIKEYLGAKGYIG